MPFPVIDTCLVCEGARPEANGKLMLFGFLGVAPNVEFGVPKASPGQSLSLTMILLGGKGSGQYQIAFEFTDDQRRVLGQKAPQFPATIDPTRRTQLVAQLVVPAITKTGKYFFRLLVDGQVHFETSIQINVAP